MFFLNKILSLVCLNSSIITSWVLVTTFFNLLALLDNDYTFASLIFDAILITLHSKTKEVKDKNDTKNDTKKSKKILMIVDITISIIFLIAYFANVIATFVSMPLIVWSPVLRSDYTKKNILKSSSFDVMQTVYFAFTCKFG